MASTSHAAWDTDRPSISPNAADLQAVPSLLTQYMACTPCTAPTSHAAWSARSYVPKLLAHRAWNPPPSSSLAEKERLRSLLLRATTTRDSRRSQLLSELLAHRAWNPPPSSSL